MIFCYRNLNKPGVTYSIRDTKTGLVAGWSTLVYLEDVTLVVSEASRQRVIRTKRKNIHAGVRGHQLVNEPPDTTWIPAYYNPYTTSCFFRKDTQTPVYCARYARLDNTGLSICI